MRSGSVVPESMGRNRSGAGRQTTKRCSGGMAAQGASTAGIHFRRASATFWHYVMWTRGTSLSQWPTLQLHCVCVQRCRCLIPQRLVGGHFMRRAASAGSSTAGAGAGGRNRASASSCSCVRAVTGHLCCPLHQHRRPSHPCLQRRRFCHPYRHTHPHSLIPDAA